MSDEEKLRAGEQAKLDREYANARDGVERLMVMMAAAVKEGGDDELVWLRMVTVMRAQSLTVSPQKLQNALIDVVGYLGLQLYRLREKHGEQK